MVGPLPPVETGRGRHLQLGTTKQSAARPDAPLIERQEITLVDKQQRLALVALVAPLVDDLALGVERPNIVFEVGRSEVFGVPGVDNLDNQVRALEDPPKLAPDLKIALERGEEEVVYIRQPGLRAERQPNASELNSPGESLAGAAGTYSARLRRHSRKASRSFRSSWRGVISLLHFGRRGTSSRLFISACCCRTCCSSCDESRCGLGWSFERSTDDVGAVMILTFWRSVSPGAAAGERWKKSSVSTANDDSCRPPRRVRAMPAAVRRTNRP